MEPAAEWKITNAWFVRQKNMAVKLTRLIKSQQLAS